MSNREYDNHDDIELSNMIHEYASDNSLRNKIEALKKEKEEEKIRQQMEPKESQDIQEPFVKEDSKDDDLEKTGVVLSNTSSTIDQQDQTMVFHDLPKNTIDVEQDDDDEMIDDEDMEEFLSEEDSISKEERDKKINKIITGVIAGLVLLCLIGLGMFGYQFIKGPSGNKEVVSETQNDTNKDKNNQDKETVDKKTEDSIDSKEESVQKQPVKPDNSTEIAGLRGQIKAYEEQVAEKKNDLQNAKSQLDYAKTELSNVEVELSKAKEEKNRLEELGGIDNKEILQELEKKIMNLETKKKEIIQKESAARTLIDEINSSISDLNSKITNLQGQLNKLL